MTANTQEFNGEINLRRDQFIVNLRELWTYRRLLHRFMLRNLLASIQ